MSEGFLGDILGGLTNYSGLNKLLQDTEAQQKDVKSLLYGSEEFSGDFNDQTGGLYGQIRDKTTFQPYGVTSAVGTGGVDAGGNVTMGLSPQQQAQMSQLGSGAMSMYNQAQTMDPRLANQSAAYMGAGEQALANSMQDTAGRESDIYSRIRAMQQPEEQRQQESMNANLFGSGRGGMSSAAYGGTPEQMAFAKAQAEARNTAGYQSMQQAQQEMMNQGSLASQYGQMGQAGLMQGAQMQGLYGQLGGQMMGQQYLPGQELRADMGVGMQQQQLMNQLGLGSAGMLSQLGIGGMTTDVNYANVLGSTYGKMVEGAGVAASGLGDWLGGVLGLTP